MERVTREEFSLSAMGAEERKEDGKKQKALIYAESKRRPLPDFVEAVQKDVTPIMRSILSDQYITSYIDKFLSANPINRRRLRLLGISSSLIPWLRLRRRLLEHVCGRQWNRHCT